MSSSVQSLIDFGSEGLVVTIECHVSNNLPNIVIDCLATRAVDEAKERVRGAMASCKLQLPRKRITINLAPADVPKESSGFDLAIAAAILQSGGKLAKNFTQTEAILGELSLDGSVRPVRGIIGKLLAGRKHGITTFYIPAANLPQASLIPNITLVPVDSLESLYMYINTGVELPKVATGTGIRAVLTPGNETELTLDDIIGQPLAKRALQIAAAGGHNLLLSGPPGTGKSMLARALPSLLPTLTAEEMLEVTHLHSLAGKEFSTVITRPPLRAPHHSASHVAIVGGGNILRPGEISLSHRGVLLFDEFPEFNRQTIESLRQPLEDRRITIARAKDSIEFPAGFILVATANPCPCGFYGTAKPCDCPAAAIRRYRAKLSGPILDRIDLYTNVHEIDHKNLLNNRDKFQESVVIRTRVEKARNRQAERFNSAKLNAHMTNRDIRAHARLSAAAKELLDSAAQSLDVSARAYMRTIKVARTVADLAESAEIEPDHITEALSFRSRNYQTVL